MTEPKDVTRLAKAMRAALAKDHRIEVPHTALRASLLKAMGENPHAFAKSRRHGEAKASPAQAPRAETDRYAKLELFVCLDQDDGSVILSIDPEFEYQVPGDWDFKGAAMVSMRMQCTRADNAYVELADQVEQAMAHYNIATASTVRHEENHEANSFVVLMPESERTKLLLTILYVYAEDDLVDEVSYYLAEQYQMFWHQEDDDKRAVWFLRYLCTDESFWYADEVTAEEIAAARPRLPAEPLPEGLKHVKGLSQEAFFDACRAKGLAFSREAGMRGRVALLLIDKYSETLTQDTWFEFDEARNSVHYVVRVVDHTVGEALSESSCEMSLAKAAVLLDAAIERQLGLKALETERLRRSVR